MLGCLTANQSTVALHAAVSYTFNDRSDLFRIVFAAGDIVQEKQRASAAADNIVDTHGNRVDSDGIMFIHQKGNFQLGPDTIGTGNQDGIFHLIACQGKQSAETSQIGHDIGAEGLLYVLFHESNRSIACFYVDTGVFILDRHECTSLFEVYNTSLFFQEECAELFCLTNRFYPLDL